MPRFLAVYMMKGDNVAAFRKLPKAEQAAIDAAGLKAWAEWDARNAAALVEPSRMVGKTLRVTTAGIAPAANEICGVMVLEAESIQAAARLVQDHPHFTIFPGDGIDLMPFVTEPPPEDA